MGEAMPRCGARRQGCAAGTLQRARIGQPPQAAAAAAKLHRQTGMRNNSAAPSARLGTVANAASACPVRGATPTCAQRMAGSLRLASVIRANAASAACWVAASGMSSDSCEAGGKGEACASACPPSPANPGRPARRYCAHASPRLLAAPRWDPLAMCMPARTPFAAPPCPAGCTCSPWAWWWGFRCDRSDTQSTT